MTRILDRLLIRSWHVPDGTLDTRTFAERCACRILERRGLLVKCHAANTWRIG